MYRDLAILFLFLWLITAEASTRAAPVAYEAERPA